MPSKRARGASKPAKSKKSTSNKRSKPTDTPTVQQPTRTSLFPGTMTKPVFAYFIDHLQATHQHATLSAVARLNKFSHKMATPKLYHHVRLPTTQSVVRFFSHFNISRPRGSIQDLSASDPLLLGRVKETFLRKAFLPTLIHHLDIDIGVHDLEYTDPPLAVKYVESSKPLFTKLETLHIATYGNAFLNEKEGSIRQAEQHGTGLLLIKSLLNLCKAKHVRWITLEGEWDFHSHYTNHLPLEFDHRSLALQSSWHRFMGKLSVESYDLPWLEKSAIGSFRTYLPQVVYPDHYFVMLAMLRRDMGFPDNVPDILTGLSIFISGLSEKEKQDLEGKLKSTFAEKLGFRFHISEKEPFTYDSADEWREWLKLDMWGEKLVYPPATAPV